MLNFRKYTNLTDVVIPNNIRLSTNDISSAFHGMRNLVKVSFNHPNIINM